MANSFWDDFKDLFKTKKRLQEEETQAVGDAVKKEEEIVKKLEELEKEYQSTIKEETVPDFDSIFKPVSLEKVSYDIKADEDIEKEASDAVNANYASKISDINKETLQKAQNLQAKKVSAEEKKNASLDEIDALFLSLAESAKNKTIKNGTQRGSILKSALSDLKVSADNDKNTVEKDYQNTLKSIDDEITTLDNDRLTALSNLDLKRAVETIEKIESLKKERDKHKAEETAKNNAIEKQENDANISIEKQKAQYINDYNASQTLAKQQAQSEENTNGYSGEKLKNYAERYNVALEFYLSLDPDVSLKALEASANMKHYLGKYYDTLKDVLTSRTSTKTNKYI